MKRLCFKSYLTVSEKVLVKLFPSPSVIVTVMGSWVPEAQSEATTIFVPRSM